MESLLKTASVRVTSIQIIHVRVQNKGKSVWKSRYEGDVSICLKALLCSYEFNTLDACWIAVDVWSSSSRCRIILVYLSRTWFLYTWSYLDILITMLNSINCSTVICSPTVILMLSWENPLVKPMAPGSILYHINLPTISNLWRRLFCFLYF